MAARKENRLKTNHRKAIQTSMLINRLSDHVLGSNEMTQTQLRAAEILLNKSLPNLKATEHTGPEGGPIQFESKAFRFVDPD